MRMEKRRSRDIGYLSLVVKFCHEVWRCPAPAFLCGQYYTSLLREDAYLEIYFANILLFSRLTFIVSKRPIASKWTRFTDAGLKYYPIPVLWPCNESFIVRYSSTPLAILSLPKGSPGHIAFTPPLPAFKTNAVDRLGLFEMCQKTHES